MPNWLRTSATQLSRIVLAGLTALALTMTPALAQEAAAGDDAPAGLTEETIPQSTPLSARVDGLRILNNDDRARLIVDLDGTTEFAIASLSGPDRIVVDVKAGALSEPIAETEAGSGLIASYAMAMAEDGRVRATLTLSAPAQVQQAYLVAAAEDQPTRLIVDLIPDSPARFAQRVSEDYKAALARLAAAEAEAAEAAAVEADAEDEVAEPPPPLIVSGAPRPLIVIDPGHGGIDGGAQAYNGATEKQIVLDFALELQKLLVEQDRFDVAMTRDDDSFIRLEDRVLLARANKADLFLSIHADKFEDPEIRGTSLYMRDENATNELDKVLAENENKADLVAGLVPPDMDERVTSLLVELMQRETRRKSYIAAQAILKSLDSHTRLRRIPLHKANFFVLQAPEVPALLIELGFLSNVQDVANLSQESWRDEAAEAIAKGVVAYFDGIAQN